MLTIEDKGENNTLTFCNHALTGGSCSIEHAFYIQIHNLIKGLSVYSVKGVLSDTPALLTRISMRPYFEAASRECIADRFQIGQVRTDSRNCCIRVLFFQLRNRFVSRTLCL